MRFNRLLVLYFFFPFVCHAQLAPQDSFGGRTDVPAPVIHPHRIPGTVSQTTTTQTFTPTNFVSASVAFTNAVVTNWSLTLSSPSLTFNLATNEAMCIDGTGTNQDSGGADWVFESTDTSADVGASHLTALNTSTGAMTLTAFKSNTVSAVAGFIRPCYASVQTIVTPFGTGSQVADPLGNWFFGIASDNNCVGSCSTQFHTNLTAKYLTDCSAASFETVDLKAGFWDAHGVNTDGVYLGYPQKCVGGAYFNPLPSLTGQSLPEFAFEAQDDRFGGSPQPALDVTRALDRTLNQGILHSLLVYQNSNFGTYMTNSFGGLFPAGANNAFYPAAVNAYSSPLTFGNSGDDVDQTDIADGSSLLPGLNFDNAGTDPGYIVAISPTHVSFVQTTKTHLRDPFIYPSDTNNYKILSGSQPAGCYATISFTTPGGNPVSPSQPKCSWVDWVRNWYQTTAAMNTAWGSTYTSFGTTETVHAAATPGTCTNSCAGNGSTSVYSFTLSSNVTPGSLHILITTSAGTQMIAGDCFDQIAICNKFGGETAAQGEIENQKVWQASQWYPVESTNFWCLPDSNNNMECESSGGKSASSHPTWSTTVGVTTTDGSPTITWTNWDSAITSGSGSFINYLTGVGQITFANALASGTSITISYTTGGWGLCQAGGTSGTGLADEDGCSANGGTTVIGGNSALLYQPLAWHASTTYGKFDDEYPNPGVIFDSASNTWQIQVNTAGCTSGNGTQPVFSSTPAVETDEISGCKWVSEPIPSGTINANQNFAIVAALWLYEHLGFYYDTMMTWHNNNFPDMPFLLPNSWYPIVRKYSTEVAQQHGMQMAFVNSLYADTTIDPFSYVKIASIESRFSGALETETYYTSPQTASGTSSSCTNGFNSCIATQALLGAAWFRHVSGVLQSAKFLGGKFNIAAVDEWSAMADIQGTGSAFIKSLADNRIDGAEDLATANLPCGNGAGNVCGNEPRGTVSANWASPYGFNSWGGATGVVSANKLWLTTSSVVPSAPCILCIAGHAQNVSGQLAVK